MRKNVDLDRFRLRPFYSWDQQWFLLTAGNFENGDFNAMTVGWGGIGVMWNRPFVQVVVRPQRYTYEFMERADSFTLSAFPQAYHEALQLLGTKSGRDGDKIAEAGLTAVASTHVAAPSFKEAELIFECGKVYWDDFEPAQFLEDWIEKRYPRKDYHRIYYGEVLAVSGVETYEG